jgi:hypothetical protein
MSTVLLILTEALRRSLGETVALRKTTYGPKYTGRAFKGKPEGERESTIRGAVYDPRYKHRDSGDSSVALTGLRQRLQARVTARRKKMQSQ